MKRVGEFVWAGQRMRDQGDRMVAGIRLGTQVTRSQADRTVAERRTGSQQLRVAELGLLVHKQVELDHRRSVQTKTELAGKPMPIQRHRRLKAGRSQLTLQFPKIPRRQPCGPSSPATCLKELTGTGGPLG